MSPLRLLVFLEATTVTGPSKNLLQFVQLAQQHEAIETTVAVFRRAGDPTVFQQAAERQGLTVEWIEEKGRYDSSVLVRMRALAQRLQPDIVQTHAVKGHFLARRAGLPQWAPWVAFHHGYTWTNLRVRLYNQLDRWSLRSATRVVTVSQPFAADLQSQGVDRARITVIHNAIDPQWGQGRNSELRARLGIPADVQVLLLVGRFSLEKDHSGLLKAMAELGRRGFPDLRLVLVGDGLERPRVEAEAAALGIQDRVIFTGSQPTAEPYYGIADVVVLNSRTEGSPNALLEAMAAGVPVVATRVGGIPEIVADRESALLVPAGNVAQLTEALAEVLRDPALCRNLVQAAHAAVEQRHAPLVRVRRLAELYRETAAAERGRR